MFYLIWTLFHPYINSQNWCYSSILMNFVFLILDYKFKHMSHPSCEIRIFPWYCAKRWGTCLTLIKQNPIRQVLPNKNPLWLDRGKIQNIFNDDDDDDDNNDNNENEDDDDDDSEDDDDGDGDNGCEVGWLDPTLSGVLSELKCLFLNLKCVEKLYIGLSCTYLLIYTWMFSGGPVVLFHSSLWNSIYI